MILAEAEKGRSGMGCRGMEDVFRSRAGILRGLPTMFFMSLVDEYGYVRS